MKFHSVLRYEFHYILQSSRCILAPLNKMVEVVNASLLREMEGSVQLYRSVDTATTEEDELRYQPEFLNKIEGGGLPPHELALKVGCPVICLRNMDNDVCNGTRLIVRALKPNLIETEILTGAAAGKAKLIPRIPIIHTDKNMVKFKRLQFPLRLSFCLSVNKSQGQTFKIAGLYLEKPCFAHGQLYVGVSRVGAADRLFIGAAKSEQGEPNATKNLVIRSVIARNH